MDLAPPTDARPDWDPGNFVDALSSLSCSSGHSCTGFVTLQGMLQCLDVTASGECCGHEGVYLVGCGLLVSVACQAAPI